MLISPAKNEAHAPFTPLYNFLSATHVTRVSNNFHLKLSKLSFVALDRLITLSLVMDAINPPSLSSLF